MDGRLLDLGFIHARTWGAHDGDHAVLVLHGASADARVADSGDGPGWWSALVGPGRAIDTSRWFVISATIPDGASSLADIVEIQSHLLGILGIGRIRLVVGGSLGGMQALAWAILQPHRMDRVLAIATAPQLGREATRLLRHAHRPHAPGDPEMSRSVQRDAATAFTALGLRPAAPLPAEPLPYNTWMTRTRLLLDGIPSLDAAPARSGPARRGGSGDPTSALRRLAARIRAPVVLLGYHDDAIFPPGGRSRFAASIRAAGGWAEARSISGSCGHDSFLADQSRLAPWLAQALDPAPWTLPGRCRPGPPILAA